MINLDHIEEKMSTILCHITSSMTNCLLMYGIPLLKIFLATICLMLYQLFLDFRLYKCPSFILGQEKPVFVCQFWHFHKKEPRKSK